MSGSRHAPFNGNLAAVLLEKERALAGLHTLELGVKSSQLIPFEQAERVMFEHARAMRDAWLNGPARVGATMAAELNIDVDRVTRMLACLAHQHLSEMAAPVLMPGYDAWQSGDERKWLHCPKMHRPPSGTNRIAVTRANFLSRANYAEEAMPQS
ncbi:hypothetical protein [Paraburkholderia susongensis]|uniref:hypothetical protein n=1 Tax=Paraburkholderia susongensis TaxID=1515439 RepID=UPI000A1CB7CC|nr:hypothetical protein [Paraburkholderia susongensis]